MTGRAYPYAEQSEAAVLGGILMDGADALKRAQAAGLTEAHFYKAAHRSLYGALVPLAMEAVVLDPRAVRQALEDAGLLETVGGWDYVAWLGESVATSANIAYHVGTLREHAQRRALIHAAEEAAETARAGVATASEVASELQAAITPVAVERSERGFVHVRDVLWRALERIEHAGDPDKRSGVRFGYPELDDVLSGIQPGELVIQCHVSGHGKTAWAFNVAKNAAMDDGVPTAVVMAEGTKESGVTRLLNMTALVSTTETRSGQMHDDAAWPRLALAAQQLAQVPLYVDDAPMPTWDSVCAKLRRLKTEHPTLGFVVMDYLQLLQAGTGSRGRDEGRSRELDLICNGLKGLAKELDLAILATAQPNADKIESRSEKKPTLKDIGWTQAARYAADFVLLGYMPHMYGPVPRHTLEIEVAKGRDLPTFSVSLDWEGRYLLVDSAGRRRLLHDRHRAPLKAA